MKFQPPAFNLHGLTLRPIRAEDAAAWFAYLAKPEVNCLTSWDVRRVEELQPMIERHLGTAPDSPIRLVLAERSSDKLIGTIGFHSIIPKDKVAEIAYDLVPRLWGNGIATEACRVVAAQR